MRSLLSALLLLLIAPVLAAWPARAECDAVVSAPPAESAEGVKALQYSSRVSGGSLQQNCFVLANPTNATKLLRATLELQQPDPMGAPGPWSIDPGFVTTVQVPNGAAVSCSVLPPSFTRVAISPVGGALLPQTATDACCFSWISTNGQCEGLPQPGDVFAYSLFVNGMSGEELALTGQPPSIPSGGSTCGLLGLEAVVLLPLLAWRRRAQGPR